MEVKGGGEKLAITAPRKRTHQSSSSCFFPFFLGPMVPDEVLTRKPQQSTRCACQR